jgi:O-antigen/teichoic acid export membrane protein
MVRAALTRLAKGSIVYGVGGVLQRFMGLLLLPFFTRVLTPEDYGVVALISLVTIAMGGPFNLGTGNSLGVLYFREPDPRRRPTIIWSTVALVAVNATLLYLLLYAAAPTLSGLMFRTDRYADLIRLSLLGLLFATVTDPWLAFLRMEEKARAYVAFTVLSSLLSIGLSAWFVLGARMGVTGLILAGTLAHGAMLVVAWATIGRRLTFRIDASRFLPLARIGLPSIFGLFAFLVIDYADRQMIERMLGLDALGLYSIGYSFGMVMTIAMGAFTTAWAPFFQSYIHRTEEARAVFGRVLTYYLIGFGALVVLFFYGARPLVLVLTAPAFHGAYAVVGLVAAAYMLKGCYLILLPGIYYAEQLHKQVGIEWAAAIVNIGLNLWLIPIYGIRGAAIATLGSYLCLPVLAWLVARRSLAVDYQWGRVASVTGGVALGSALLGWLSSGVNAGLLGSILINTLVLAGLFAAGYRFLLTRSERKIMRCALRI